MPPKSRRIRISKLFSNTAGIGQPNALRRIAAQPLRHAHPRHLWLLVQLWEPRQVDAEVGREPIEQSIDHPELLVGPLHAGRPDELVHEEKSIRAERCSHLFTDVLEPLDVIQGVREERDIERGAGEIEMIDILANKARPRELAPDGCVRAVDARARDVISEICLGKATSDQLPLQRALATPDVDHFAERAACDELLHEEVDPRSVRAAGAAAVDVPLHFGVTHPVELLVAPTRRRFPLLRAHWAAYLKAKRGPLLHSARNAFRPAARGCVGSPGLCTASRTRTTERA